jgi:two-component system CheB/CheR fusion protein
MASERKSRKQRKSARQPSETVGTATRVEQASVRKTAGAKEKKSDQEEVGCPIVGIGGSAGGFEAAMEFLKHVPPKCGTAFAIVQHLDPHHASRLAVLLGRVTKMPVTEVTGTLVPKPDTVYVQPASKCLICKDGSLVLEGRTQVRNVAIDHFFESLAECRGSRAIGVVLSGTGSDGTAGLRAIKAAGGLTFAQDPQTAKFDAMPNSAIRAGFVDAVLSPGQIAQEVGRIAKHPYWRSPFSDAAEAQKVSYDEADDLGRIFLSLKKFTGVDFSSYKHSTLNRRIQRRMALHRIERLGQYARFLRDNKAEAESLFSDLLINVTRFFRDKGVFTALQKKFLPAILKKKDRNAELRVWVPGCASGEEVYSLAICILETLGKRAATVPVQIFGTDLSEFAIEHARAGIYSATIAKDVSPARLKRFFTKRDSMYQIGRHVRDLCTFARQNIAADAPFSRIDLISCRNVLIYLGPELHKRCLPHFHYALRPGGFLILGPAESVGVFEELFQLVDRKNKIYAKKNVPTPQSPLGLYLNRSSDGLVDAKLPILDPGANRQLRQTADRIMLSVYAPAAVVVDSEMQVQQFRGRTDDYLAHAPGQASLNIFQIVQASLAPDLRSAFHRAQKTKKPVRKDRALVKAEGKMREINIQVVPFKIPESAKFWFLVIFDETTRANRPGVLPRILGRTATQREVGELRQQLAASKESLQTIIEEQEATNEELKSANEEIESSNEELQSTNEELETAKEELQSTNEELTTLNEELSNRNLEMMQLNSDLSNLLSSIQLPIVTVDSALKVRRVTPAARNAFNILQSDVGRPISDFKPNIGVGNLEQMLREVIDTLTTQEKKVSDRDGRSFLLRIRPYRTGDNKIDGAVLTLVDLSNKSGNHQKKKNAGNK